MRPLLPLVTCLIIGSMAAAWIGRSPGHSSSSLAAVRADPSPLHSRFVTVWLDHGANRTLPRRIAGQMDTLHGWIGRDFRTNPPSLSIHLYATHHAFAAALWRQQRERPQTETDDTSNIVHGTLLLGPLLDSYLRHDLVHVYTEWIVDRLIGNHSDTLPSNPWLYDGLAEYEAYRYAPGHMRCTSHGSPPLDVLQVRTARQWLQLRAGPLGALEYCLAYLEVRGLVERFGWSAILRGLHGPNGWSCMATQLAAARGSPLACQTSGSSTRHHLRVPPPVPAAASSYTPSAVPA